MLLPSSQLVKLKLSNGCYCFQKSGNTYKLLLDIKWRDIVNINHTTDYFSLKPYEIIDGQCYTIDMEDISYAGLFTTSGIGTDINTASKIMNLGILNGFLNKDGCSFFYRQFQHYVRIDNCFSTGPIGVNDGVTNAHGISCQLSGSPNACLVTNCYSTGDILGERSGGIAGLTFGYQGNGENTIQNCYSTGNIIGNRAGGIISDAASFGGSVNIIECYSLGNVLGAEAGGITSVFYDYLDGELINIQNCYSKSNILHGVNNHVTVSIQNCYSDVSLVTIDSANIIKQNSVDFMSDASLSILNTPSSYVYNGKTYSTNGNSYIKPSLSLKQKPILRSFTQIPWIGYKEYDSTPNNKFLVKYKGNPFYFNTFNNPMKRLKKCGGSLVFDLPKKVKVFNKPEQRLSKKELIAWASRNKYR